MSRQENTTSPTTTLNSEEKEEESTTEEEEEKESPKPAFLRETLSGTLKHRLQRLCSFDMTTDEYKVMKIRVR